MGRPVYNLGRVDRPQQLWHIDPSTSLKCRPQYVACKVLSTFTWDVDGVSVSSKLGLPSAGIIAGAILLYYYSGDLLRGIIGNAPIKNPCLLAQGAWIPENILEM